MKVLLDTCVAAAARDALQAAGHDVIWGGDWEEDPGDEAILARAYAEGRVLITLDKDYGELANLRRLPHCGIVRLVDFRSTDQGPASLAVLEDYEEEVRRGAMITAELGRVRIRQ